MIFPVEIQLRRSWILSGDFSFNIGENRPKIHGIGRSRTGSTSEFRLSRYEARWDRGWINRARYVHPYPRVVRYEPGKIVERHRVIGHTTQAREAARTGRMIR